MSEENVINISGIDFGLAYDSREGKGISRAKYERLHDKIKGIFSTWKSSDEGLREKYGSKPRAEKCKIESNVENKDKILRYRLKLHENIVFDISNVIRMKDVKVEKIKDFLGRTPNSGLSYHVNISKKILIGIQSNFKKADVLFFSGHHFGDNYHVEDKVHENYCMPGLLNKGFDGKPWTPSFSLQSLFPVLDQEENSEKAEYNVYDNVKLIIAVGCKYIRRNMFCLYKKLFPNAVVLGYHCSGPDGDEDAPLIIDFFNRMNWRCLLKDSCSENYKEEIVDAWKAAVEGQKSVSKIRKHFKPGYYYTTAENEKTLKVELNKYYGKIIENNYSFKEGRRIINFTTERTVPENFEALPYKVSTNKLRLYKYLAVNDEKKIKTDFYSAYEIRQKNVESDNVVITMADDDEKNNDGEGKLYINHGYNYLVDDAYRSEYYGIVCDEEDVEEHEEIGYIPIQEKTDPFWETYKPTYWEKDKKSRKKNYDDLMKVGMPCWRSILPEGKLYDMKTYTEIDDDV